MPQVNGALKEPSQPSIDPLALSVGGQQSALQQSEPAGLPPIGYVLDTFPATSETFILREVQQLLQDNVDLTLTAFRPPAHILHRDALKLSGQVAYRPVPLSTRFWRLALSFIVSPAFWRLAIELVREGLAADSPTLGKVKTGHPSRFPRTLWRERICRLNDILPLWHILPTAAWLAGIFRQHGVKHLHGHFLGAPATATRAAARLMGVSFSLSVHGSDLFRRDPFRKGNVTTAQFVLACTAKNQAWIRSQAWKSPERVHLVYHGLDLDEFSTGPRQKTEGSLDTAEPLLICVARLAPKKGVDVLLGACQRLYESGLPVRCEIFGDGPEREHLERRAGELGLRDRVVFRGACSQEQVLDGYRRAALFVLPCRVAADGDADGLPNVIIEALAMRIPVVSTPVGAVTEIIEHGITGRLTPPDDAVALADEIAWLLGHPDQQEQMAETGRRRVQEHFDLKLDRVKDVFEQELLA